MPQNINIRVSDELLAELEALRVKKERSAGIPVSRHALVLALIVIGLKIETGEKQ